MPTFSRKLLRSQLALTYWVRSFCIGTRRRKLSTLLMGSKVVLTLLLLMKSLRGEASGVAGESEAADSPVVVVRRAFVQRVQDIDPSERNELQDFISRRCQVIRVETDDADEAFRVFDSQNYRGKSLLPHDLLKAHHLRVMHGESPAMQTAIVESWESVPDAELDRLFSTYLWRIQRWNQGLPAPTFAVQHIGTFKGVTTTGTVSPSARYHLAAQAAIPMLSAWKPVNQREIRDLGRARFQLDAPITAGRTFFEMVDFLLSEIRSLRREGFDGAKWEQFVSSDKSFKEIASKSRYRYVSELYIAALLSFTNKFGDSEMKEARVSLFRWAYGVRARMQRVQFITVDKLARGSAEVPSAFMLLRQASSPAALRELPYGELSRSQDTNHERELQDFLSGMAN